MVESSSNRTKGATGPSSPAPSISVIIPTYNRAGFLRQCIGSLRECGPADLEIIVVDDGSTDDTAEVVGALKPSCIYLKQSNQGPAAARNLGFGRSTGRYVAFVDSDDEWLPETPCEAVRFLDAYREVDVLFAEARMGNHEEGFQSWIELAGEAEFNLLPARIVENEIRILERSPLFRRMAVRNPVFIGSTIMRREAFAQAGLFDIELWGAADWELWLRMAARMTFAWCPRPLAIYTRHSQCMSNDHDVMRAEFASALAGIRRKCDDLEPVDRALIERQLRYHLFGHAYAAYDLGDQAAARQRLGRLCALCGLTPFEMLFFGLCLLPPVVTRLLRAFWRVGRTSVHP